MSSWRVEQHYGFGAAKIPIRPEPHSSEMLGVMEGAFYLVGELFAGGPAATVRRLIGQAPAMMLGVLLFTAFIVTLTRDRTDESPIEVVLFDSADVLPEPLPEPVIYPEPIIPEPVEVAQPEPPKPVTPKPPPPPQIAKIPKPTPPPPPLARPTPKPKARPRLVVPQIARVETPRIMKPERTERALRDRPEQVTRRNFTIDVAKPRPIQKLPAPKMDRVARAKINRPAAPRPAPRMTTPAAPDLAERPQDPPPRSFRVATAKPVSGLRAQARPGLAPAPAVREATPAPPTRNALRSKPSRPSPTGNTPRIAPRLDRARVLAAPLVSVSTPDRGARPAPRPAARRVVRPAAQLARSTSAREMTAASPALASRTGRAAPATPRGTSGDRPGVAGVPLGDLAACLSDREEDRLKQAVVAAVTTQEECVSSKGTYRFIETKNLNAFLMWIDRAPARVVSDRCVELGYALECLNSASQRAAR